MTAHLTAAGVIREVRRFGCQRGWYVGPWSRYGYQALAANDAIRRLIEEDLSVKKYRRRDIEVVDAGLYDVDQLEDLPGKWRQLLRSQERRRFYLVSRPTDLGVIEIWDVDDFEKHYVTLEDTP